MQVKDIAEFGATGMLIKVYPVVCVRATQPFNAHLSGAISKSSVGITLFVNLQGCGRPQSADEQMWMPTFFVVWLEEVKS